MYLSARILLLQIFFILSQLEKIPTEGNTPRVGLEFS